MKTLIHEVSKTHSHMKVRKPMQLAAVERTPYEANAVTVGANASFGWGELGRIGLGALAGGLAAL